MEKTNCINPTVTVGIPVYNGEPYIKQAIESVLNQSFSDFELIISDNASTDCTSALCLEYAQKDSRIVYIKQASNIGAINNFNYVASVARGAFFCWLAADDFLDAEFLDETVRYLQMRKEVGLVAVDFRVVDVNGHGLEVERLISLRPDVNWKVRRAHLMSKPTDNAYFAIYGLFRTHLLKSVTAAVKEVQVVSNSEYLYLSRVACLGQIDSLPKILRLYRKHTGCSHLAEKRILQGASYLVRRFESARRGLILATEQKKILFLSPLSMLDKVHTLWLISRSKIMRLLRFDPKRLNGLVRAVFIRFGYDLHRVRFLDNAEFNVPHLISWCDVELFISLSETQDGIFRWITAIADNSQLQVMKTVPDIVFRDIEQEGQMLLNALNSAKRVVLHIDVKHLRGLSLEIVREALRKLSAIFIVCDKSEFRIGMGGLDDPQCAMIFNDRFALWNILPFSSNRIHGGAESYCFGHVSKDMMN